MDALRDLCPYLVTVLVTLEYAGLWQRWAGKLRRFWRHFRATLQVSFPVASRRNRGQKPLGNAGFPAVWRRVP